MRQTRAALDGSEVAWQARINVGSRVLGELPADENLKPFWSRSCQGHSCRQPDRSRKCEVAGAAALPNRQGDLGKLAARIADFAR